MRTMRASGPSALARAVPLAVVLWAMGACAPHPGVTRMVDGRRVPGRYVADEAYAAYLRGSTLEARGDLAAAESAYAEAIRRDPDNAESWTRVGTLRCHRQEVKGAEDAFARAVGSDPTYEEAWTERARCQLARGETAEALRAARTAVALDPERIEAVCVLARVLERAGRHAEAEAWM